MPFAKPTLIPRGRPTRHPRPLPTISCGRTTIPTACRRLITNSSNNFGPYQFPEKLIPLMILNAVEGKPLPVYGDGLNVRDWLFVEDHCRALRLVLRPRRPGRDVQHRRQLRAHEPGNRSRHLPIGGRTATRVCPTVRATGLIQRVPDRPGHDRRYAIDAGKIRRDLGWEPQHDFESALALTVRWYLENSAWVDGLRMARISANAWGCAAAA